MGNTPDEDLAYRVEHTILEKEVSQSARDHASAIYDDAREELTKLVHDEAQVERYEIGNKRVTISGRKNERWLWDKLKSTLKDKYPELFPRIFRYRLDIQVDDPELVEQIGNYIKKLSSKEDNAGKISAEVKADQFDEGRLNSFIQAGEVDRDCLKDTYESNPTRWPLTYDIDRKTDSEKIVIL